jgi:tetratricopeptide (TPR) repeat protein
MTDTTPLDERLVTPLLRIVDRALSSSPPAGHPDEELLAVFAAGELSGPARAAVVDHLAACVDCRKAVSTMLSMAEENASARRRPTILKLPSRRVLWPCLAAVAASLLVAALLVFPEITAEKRAYGRSLALLEAGRFSEARSTVQDAAGRGISSDRLRSLESQAMRGFRGPIALAVAGRLTAFGFDLNGAVAREPDRNPARSEAKQAEELLAAKPSQDVVLLLNRGHALLTLDRPQDALEVFRQAARSAPEQPLVWLGQGLAYFMLDDHVEAERSFRECLRLDPNSVPAKINLAMTLEEEAKPREALAVWQGLLEATLPALDRDKIRQRVEELQKPQRQ